MSDQKHIYILSLSGFQILKGFTRKDKCLYERMLKFFICLVLLLMLKAAHTDLAKGQDNQYMTTEEKPKIELLARPFSDSVVLRWAPNNSLTWEQANKTGYLLEKVTIMRNGELLTQPERIVLTQTPYLPHPLYKWEGPVKENKYAAIAAQALYGETFEVQNKTATDAYSLITKIKERDTRFSFALFAADQSPEVAKLSGLWFTDKNVKKGEKYLYRIYLAGNVIADTGIAYTGPDEFQPLPKPIDVMAEFKDRKVDLTWNQKYFLRIYNAYILERSEDGKIFSPVSEEPLVNLIPGDNTAPDLFYKTDSVPENHKTYYYRVKGINSFGELSPPSDIVSGQGHSGIEANPYFTERTVINNEKVVLNWDFPSDSVGDIDGFKIFRSSNPKVGFKPVSSGISVSSRSYTDEKPGISNYYIVSAYNGYGDEVRSAPVFVQLIDSVPPATPYGLNGMVDTTGNVSIHWKPNKDEDIFGYRVYRANYANEEFSQITVSPVQDTFFIDNITLKTLTSNVYYKIMAIDLRLNHSSFSDALELKRPDKIPPVSPVFTSVKSTKEGVYLQWVNSTSADVKDHFLYRSIPGSNEWKLIAAFGISDSVISYIDNDADLEHYCKYTLMAKDYSNLESTPARPVEGKKIDTGIRPGLENVFTEVDRIKGVINLAWKKPEGEVYRYLIYKAKEVGDLSLYTSISGNDVSYSDSNLNPNTKYKYSVKIIYADGSQSGFSKQIIINY